MAKALAKLIDRMTGQKYTRVLGNECAPNGNPQPTLAAFDAEVCLSSQLRSQKLMHHGPQHVLAACRLSCPPVSQIQRACACLVLPL